MGTFPSRIPENKNEKEHKELNCANNGVRIRIDAGAPIGLECGLGGM